jgi:hypothetical protein
MVSGVEADRLDFFISHASADQQWAEWIGQQLTGAGYNCAWPISFTSVRTDAAAHRLT